MIKTQLERAKGIWLDELLGVLWVYRTTTRITTGETPFYLAFGGKAVILVEVGLTSYRISHHNEERNEKGMRL